MSDTTQNYNGGLGLGGGLFLLFLGLQMTGYINWPWYAIAAPLLIPLAFVLVVFIVALVAYFAIRRGEVD